MGFPGGGSVGKPIRGGAIGHMLVVHHWGGLSIAAMVFGIITVVVGAVEEWLLDNKRKEYLRHMEEDAEEDK